MTDPEPIIVAEKRLNVVTVFPNVSGDWQWELKTSGGETVATSDRAFPTESDATADADAKSGLPPAPALSDRLAVWDSMGQAWFWHRETPSGQVTAGATHGYATRAEAVTAANMANTDLEPIG